jgi:hypothetical protein
MNAWGLMQLAADHIAAINVPSKIEAGKRFRKAFREYRAENGRVTVICEPSGRKPKWVVYFYQSQADKMVVCSEEFATRMHNLFKNAEGQYQASLEEERWTSDTE